MPCPLSSAGLDVAADLLQLLILPRLEADDDISLASSQGEDIDARAGTQWAESLGEGSGGIPVSLEKSQQVRNDFASIANQGCVETYIASQLSVIKVTLEDDKLSRLKLFV